MTAPHHTLWTALCVAVAYTTGLALYAQEPGSTAPLVTAEQYERWQTELSNWGRWGPEDELGAANLITATKRAEAAGLVREGFTVSLSSNAQKYDAEFAWALSVNGPWKKPKARKNLHAPGLDDQFRFG